MNSNTICSRVKGESGFDITTSARKAFTGLSVSELRAAWEAPRQAREVLIPFCRVHGQRRRGLSHASVAIPASNAYFENGEKAGRGVGRAARIFVMGTAQRDDSALVAGGAALTGTCSCAKPMRSSGTRLWPTWLRGARTRRT
jgi:hypothetical protein